MRTQRYLELLYCRYVKHLQRGFSCPRHFSLSFFIPTVLHVLQFLVLQSSGGARLLRSVPTALPRSHTLNSSAFNLLGTRYIERVTQS